jgi:hypothetical protein
MTNDPFGPRRIPPAEAASEIVERVAPRRHIQIEPDDVVIVRERLPRVNPRLPPEVPLWRFRLGLSGSAGPSSTFTSFAHAASAGEQLATERRTRLMYIEDDVPALLADYRRA